MPTKHGRNSQTYAMSFIWHILMLWRVLARRLMYPQWNICFVHFDLTSGSAKKNPNKRRYVKFDRSRDNHLFKLLILMDLAKNIMNILSSHRGPHCSFNGVNLWLALYALVDTSALFCRNNEVQHFQALMYTAGFVGEFRDLLLPCQLGKRALWV